MVNHESILLNARYQFGECNNLYTVRFKDGKGKYEGKGEYEGQSYTIVSLQINDLQECNDRPLAAVLIEESYSKTSSKYFTLFAFYLSRGKFRLIASIYLGEGSSANAFALSDGTVSGEILTESGEITNEITLNCNFFKIPIE